jgi:acid phosphatase
MSALGLWNGTGSHDHIYPLSLTTPNPKRDFRASFLVSFRGYVALERLQCAIGAPTAKEAEDQGVFHVANQLGGIVKGHSQGHNATYVRVRVSNAPVAIPSCQSGPGATCPLSQFVTYVDEQRAAFAGDFVERCGLEGVDGAVSKVSFLTTAGDETEVLVGLN